MRYSVCLCILVILKLTYGQYGLGDISSGLRLTVQTKPLTNLLGIHDNSNKGLQTDIGAFRQDLTIPTYDFGYRQGSGNSNNGFRQMEARDLTEDKRTSTSGGGITQALRSSDSGFRTSTNGSPDRGTQGSRTPTNEFRASTRGSPDDSTRGFRTPTNGYGASTNRSPGRGTQGSRTPNNEFRESTRGSPDDSTRGFRTPTNRSGASTNRSPDRGTQGFRTPTNRSPEDGIRGFRTPTNGFRYNLDSRSSENQGFRSRDRTCQPSVTLATGFDNVCSGTSIFQEEFLGDTINEINWINEQYLPEAPDYEFVVYMKDDTVIYQQNEQLIIKPKLKNENELFQSLLDLTNGCTKEKSPRFKCLNRLHLLQNPIISGRLRSQKLFKYADVEIKAKLPAGDWMYPEIYFEDENYNRLIIAYARGNKIFKGNDDENIGGPLLFGGPMLSAEEPKRSETLSSYRHPAGPLSDDFHVYRLRWTPEQIDLFIDGQHFGSRSGDIFPNKSHLVIGVGVGGINDFPNDFKSGDIPKPWKNFNKYQVKNFYESRHQWLPSWERGGALQVEYVKITSL